MLRNVAVPVLAPVPAFELGVVCEAFGLGAAPPTPPPPAALVRQLRDAVTRGATIASACTGAFVLAAAGLLDGRRATTHWLHAPLLATLYPQLTVEPDRLYIEDGPIVTSAGSAVSGLPNPLRADTEAMVSLPRSRRRAASLRRHFTQARGITPDRYRRAFRLTEPAARTAGPAGHQAGNDAAPALHRTPSPQGRSQ